MPETLAAASPERVSARLLAATGGAAALAYLAGLWFQLPVLCLVVKPLPVLALAAWLLADAGLRATYARRVACGLALSALGDVLLEMPSGFLPGLGAFLLAHLVYIAAFVGETRALRPLRALPFAAYGLTLFAWLRPGLGALAAPVAAYAAALSILQWRAAACVGASRRGRSAEALGLGGAVLFALSDSLIGLDRFHEPLLGARYAIILLYWAGQAGLALSARPTR